VGAEKETETGTRTETDRQTDRRDIESEFFIDNLLVRVHHID
jgi:hypothetical protein